MNEALNGKFSTYLNQVKFLVQPVLNPDGYAHTHSSSRMWRKNRSPQGKKRAIKRKWFSQGPPANVCITTPPFWELIFVF